MPSTQRNRRRHRIGLHTVILILTLPLAVLTGPLRPARCEVLEVRVKDVTTLQGERANQLYGMGIVTGLSGTGKSNAYTRQAFMNAVEKLGGLRADPALRAMIRNNAALSSTSIGLVAVSGLLDTNVRSGQTIQVDVSTFDDTSSLQGGVLLPTPLFSHDHKVYAVARGKLVVGGFTASGAGASVTKNVPTVARVEAIVEGEVPFDITERDTISLLLNYPDYQVATSIAQAINQQFPGTAKTLNNFEVQVIIPSSHALKKQSFIAQLQQLRIEPDMKALVVINPQTGTLAMTRNVKLSQGAVSHGNLLVSTSESPIVSQPAPLSGGETTVLPRTDLNVEQEKGLLRSFDDAPHVEDLVAIMNAMGLTTQDMISVFQAMRDAHMLHAEIIIK